MASNFPCLTYLHGFYFLIGSKLLPKVFKDAQTSPRLSLSSFLFSGLSSDHSPMYPPVHPSVYLSVQTLTCQPTHPSSVHTVIHPFVRPASTYPSIHIPICHPATRLSTHASIHPYLFIYLAMCLLNTYFVLGPVVGLC